MTLATFRSVAFCHRQQRQNPLVSLFSTNAVKVTTTTTTPTTAGRNRLAALRQQLQAQQNETLDDFVPQKIIRKKAPPRSKKILPKPSWLKVQPADTSSPNSQYMKLRNTVQSLGLATVCEEARCPNIGECWGGSKSSDNEHGVATATIMILGDTCTRGCRFCSVATSRTPPPLDPNEPQKVATAISKWGLDYVVLTSVDRDDLPDQGANQFAAVVRGIKEKKPNIWIETLAPDFQGNTELLTLVAQSGPDVFAHNMETVEDLTSRVRDRRASYLQSLHVLEFVKKLGLQREHSLTSSSNISVPVLTKTSLMLGLGETQQQIQQTLTDLRTAGVDVVTFGQYLQPTRNHLAVKEYIHPTQFDEWKDIAEQMGFLYVASGPMVRSSYKAGEFFLQNVLQQKKKEKEEKQRLVV